jgi:pilus assembly protein CpaE
LVGAVAARSPPVFTLIASDSPSIATKVRKALALHGHECPITHLVGLEQIAPLLQSAATAVDLLFLVLPTDESRSLGMIRRIRALTAAQLVAVGSAKSSKHILETLHAGADDYVDEEDDLAEQVRGSLERMELRSETVPTGKMIAVTSASGGSGATMVAANLAVKLAQRASTCGLVELAAGFGDLGSLFNVAPKYTIADLLRNQESFDRAMLEQSIVAHASGVRLLAAANPFDDLDELNGSAIGRIITFGRTLHPWTVLDVDSRSGRNVDLLKPANAIVLTFRFDFTSLCNTRRLMDAWRQLQIEPERIVLVGNRFGQSGEVPLDQAQTLLGKEIAIRIPDDVLHVNVAANCGNPAVLEAPKSPVARALTQLADRLAGSCAQTDRSTGSNPELDGSWHGNPIVKKVAGILFC